MTFLYHKLSENFCRIFLEKYRYFSKNFRKNSAGNFQTYNPTTSHVKSAWQGSIVHSHCRSTEDSL